MNNDTTVQGARCIYVSKQGKAQTLKFSVVLDQY